MKGLKLSIKALKVETSFVTLGNLAGLYLPGISCLAPACETDSTPPQWHQLVIFESGSAKVSKNTL